LREREAAYPRDPSQLAGWCHYPLLDRRVYKYTYVLVGFIA